MRRFILFIILSIIGVTVSYAQNTATDRYYQDLISSMINTGRSLIDANETEEGLIYLKDAIRIAINRGHDYMAAIIVINSKVVNQIVDYYYSVDSTSQARRYIDYYADLYKRYPDYLLINKEIDGERYTEHLAACYGSSATMAQNNNDNQYTIKYHELYVEHSKNSEQFKEVRFSILWDLVFEYLNNEQYLNALSTSISMFDEKRGDGTFDEESIGTARLVYNHVKSKAFLSPSIIPTANQANEMWLSFIMPLYKEKGDYYMDSLLMKMDGQESWREEIEYEMNSTTMIAALMSRCLYALQLGGYDAAKKKLFDYRNYLYDKGKSELWPVASVNFVNSLETRKLHSATYSFCKSIEQDFISQSSISKSDMLEYYIFYFGASNRMADIGKCFDIIHNQFDSVDESNDLFWLVSRLKGFFFLKIGYYEEGLTYTLSALEHYSFPAKPHKGDAIMYASLYSNVGNAYRRIGKITEAIEYFQKGIALCDQYDIPEDKLDPYFNLGRIYHEKGELDRARDFFLLCADIQSRTGAKYATSAPFSYLFDIERRSGNVEKARQYLTSTWKTKLSEYLDFKEYLTIQEQTSYWTAEGNICFVGGLVAESSPCYNDIYYDMLLVSKGFLLKEESIEYNNVYSSGDSRLEELYALTHSGDGINQEGNDEYMALYRSHNFTSEIENTSWKKVQSMLLKNDVAIEFFKYDVEDRNNLSPQYGALLLKTGWKSPKFVHLCSAAELESATNAQQNAYTVDGLLYGLIWGPLSRDLKGVNNIYFSPQGLLHTLNLSAILDNNGDPMYKSYNMYRLSSTQGIYKISNPAIKSSFVYGGLIYDSDDETMLSEHRKYSITNNPSTGEDWPSDISSSRHGWSYLPNSETETKRITELLKGSSIDVVRYSGVEGTEESFKALSGSYPGVIHLATHGFYLPYSYADSASIATSHEMKVAASQSAFVRSGLIMSNGGRAWKGETIPNGVEDGILQADEIARVDLSGTSLLVLSACETALGDLSSDGVYGLQRAFKMAGVETIIMSLWEVDDKATSLFMSFFYEAWTKGKSKHDAFVDAQDSLRQMLPNPYYWAAFIMLD